MHYPYESYSKLHSEKCRSEKKFYQDSYQDYLYSAKIVASKTAKLGKAFSKYLKT